MKRKLPEQQPNDSTQIPSTAFPSATSASLIKY